ncbi:XRE family transcriptional regulator [Xanthobacteraceae bacterium A53D]
MPLDPFQQWVADGLEASSASQSDLARALGVHPSIVNKITSGKRKVHAREIDAIAEFLGLAPPVQREALEAITDRLIPIRVTGDVRAGAFQQVDEFDDFERHEVYAPRDTKYPHARVVAFKVVGSSMNAAEPEPMPSGTEIICVDFEDIDEPLRDKSFVVVEQVTADGHMREWSVKQVEVHVGRYEFHPRSTDPRHKPIVVNTDLHADDGRTVRVLALVRRVSREMP